MTWAGAGHYGGMAAAYAPFNVGYNEDEQSNYINTYCKMLNNVRIDGCFYIDYFETWLGSNIGFGLINKTRRKKGFYMYKSYQRTGQ